MKKIMAAIALLLALGIPFTVCHAEDAEPGYRMVDMDEAIAMMETEENYIILDVRTLSEFNNLRIPGAINVPNESISSKPIEELPDKDQLILVYCRSGNRSKQAAQKLAEQGYTNIVEFGGIIDWPREIIRGN